MIQPPSVNQSPLANSDSESDSDTSREDLPPLIASDSESDESSDSDDDEPSNDDSPRLFRGFYSAPTPELGRILILEQDMTEISEAGDVDEGKSGPATLMTYGSHLSVFVADGLYCHAVNSSRVTISGADLNASTVTNSLLRNVSAESGTQGVMVFTQENADLFCRQLDTAPRLKDAKPSVPATLSRLSLSKDASPAFCRADVGMPELSGLGTWVEQNRDTYPQGSAGPMRRNRRHRATWNPLQRPTTTNVAQVNCYICSERHNTRQCRLRGAITEA
eukprot:2109522-Rhodomonas_salina.2